MAKKASRAKKAAPRKGRAKKSRFVFRSGYDEARMRQTIDAIENFQWRGTEHYPWKASFKNKLLKELQPCLNDVEISKQAQKVCQAEFGVLR